MIFAIIFLLLILIIMFAVFGVVPTLIGLGLIVIIFIGIKIAIGKVFSSNEQTFR